MTAAPTLQTVEACDRELVQYRRALTLVSVEGKVAVWEQIDRILEIRHQLAGGSGGATVTIPPSGDDIVASR